MTAKICNSNHCLWWWESKHSFAFLFISFLDVLARAGESDRDAQKTY